MPMPIFGSIYKVVAGMVMTNTSMVKHGLLAPSLSESYLYSIE